MKQDILRVSWEEVGQQIDQLKEKIERRYNMVVGLSRGGLIPAVALSHHLKAPLVEVQIKSYNVGGEQEQLICSTPDSVFREWYGNILVVDDLVDTGDTLYFLLNKINNNYFIKRCITAVLFYKEQSIVKPDYFIEKTDKWVEFPWEQTKK